MKNLKRFTCLFMVFMAAFLFSQSLTVKAELDYPKKQIFYLFKNFGSYNIGFSELTDISQIKNLKSSNKKVATVKKVPHPYGVMVCLSPKKPGKTVITFDIIYNNKRIHRKSKVYVWKQKNPFKSFKLGKKSYTKKYKNDDIYTVEKAIKGKLSYRLKKGWKLAFAELRDDMNETSKKYKKAKNKTFSIKPGQSLILTLVYKNNWTHKKKIELNVAYMGN